MDSRPIHSSFVNSNGEMARHSSRQGRPFIHVPSRSSSPDSVSSSYSSPRRSIATRGLLSLTPAATLHRASLPPPTLHLPSTPLTLHSLPASPVLSSLSLNPMHQQSAHPFPLASPPVLALSPSPVLTAATSSSSSNTQTPPSLISLRPAATDACYATRGLHTSQGHGQSVHPQAHALHASAFPSVSPYTCVRTMPQHFSALHDLVCLPGADDTAPPLLPAHTHAHAHTYTQPLQPLYAYPHLPAHLLPTGPSTSYAPYHAPPNAPPNAAPPASASPHTPLRAPLSSSRLSSPSPSAPHTAVATQPPCLPPAPPSRRTSLQSHARSHTSPASHPSPASQAHHSPAHAHAHAHGHVQPAQPRAPVSSPHAALPPLHPQSLATLAAAPHSPVLAPHLPHSQTHTAAAPTSTPALPEQPRAALAPVRINNHYDYALPPSRRALVRVRINHHYDYRRLPPLQDSGLAGDGESVGLRAEPGERGGGARGGDVGAACAWEVVGRGGEAEGEDAEGEAAVDVGCEGESAAVDGDADADTLSQHSEHSQWGEDAAEAAAEAMRNDPPAALSMALGTQHAVLRRRSSACIVGGGLGVSPLPRASVAQGAAPLPHAYVCGASTSSAPLPPLPPRPPPNGTDAAVAGGAGSAVRASSSASAGVEVGADAYVDIVPDTGPPGTPSPLLRALASASAPQSEPDPALYWQQGHAQMHPYSHSYGYQPSHGYPYPYPYPHPYPYPYAEASYSAWPPALHTQHPHRHASSLARPAYAPPHAPPQSQLLGASHATQASSTHSALPPHTHPLPGQASRVSEGVVGGSRLSAAEAETTDHLYARMGSVSATGSFASAGGAHSSGASLRFTHAHPLPGALSQSQPLARETPGDSPLQALARAAPRTQLPAAVTVVEAVLHTATTGDPARQAQGHPHVPAAPPQPSAEAREHPPATAPPEAAAATGEPPSTAAMPASASAPTQPTHASGSSPRRPPPSTPGPSLLCELRAASPVEDPSPPSPLSSYYVFPVLPAAASAASSATPEARATRAPPRARPASVAPTAVQATFEPPAVRARASPARHRPAAAHVLPRGESSRVVLAGASARPSPLAVLRVTAPTPTPTAPAAPPAQAPHPIAPTPASGESRSHGSPVPPPLQNHNDVTLPTRARAPTFIAVPSACIPAPVSLARPVSPSVRTGSPCASPTAAPTSTQATTPRSLRRTALALSLSSLSTSRPAETVAAAVKIADQSMGESTFDRSFTDVHAHASALQSTSESGGGGEETAPTAGAGAVVGAVVGALSRVTRWWGWSADSEPARISDVDSLSKTDKKRDKRDKAWR